MKIEHEYLKGLLEAFEAAENPTTDILELKKRGFDFDDKRFQFHYDILKDQDFIRNAGKTQSLGYTLGSGGDIGWSVIPLRMTASGHEFLEALRNKEVWEVIKKGFKDASIDTLWKVSKDLLEAYSKKKIKELLTEQ